MTRISFWDSAGTFDVPGKGEFPQKFAAHAFDQAVGKRIPVRGPAGRRTGTATVVAVEVDEDGGGATWTVDVDDSHPAADPVFADQMAVSFAVPEPADLARDPLAAGELRIRWRRAPATRAGTGQPAASFSFVLRIRTPDGRPLTAVEIEALYEAGLSDAAVETGPRGSLADFDREAPDRQAAIDSAMADIRKVPGLTPEVPADR